MTSRKHGTQINLQDSLTSELQEHLVAAQKAQEKVDASVSRLVFLLRASKESIEHEIVDQAVLNGESLQWIIDEIKSWEKYRSEISDT